MEEELYTVTEVIDKFGIVNRQHLLKILKQKRIRALKKGWLWLIPHSELGKLEEILKNGRAKRVDVEH